MIGAIAIKGDELFFSETISKPNLGPCKYPLENWLTPVGIFIPLTTHSLLAMVIADQKTPNDFATMGDVPNVCGILITPARVISEIATIDGRVVMRSVPYGIGTIYTRGEYMSIEDNLYASIKLTDSLKKAVDLADRNCACISSDPVFTSVSIVAYAAYKKDPGLIRTTTTSDMIKILDHEYQRLEALNKDKD